MKYFNLNLSFSRLLQQNNLIKSGLVFSICLILATGAYLHWRNQQPPATQPSASPKGITNVKSDLAIFYSKTMAIMAKTFVKVTYKLPSQPAEIWLNLETLPDKEPVAVLIVHPVLSNLSWPQISNVKYTLWQKNPTYTSVDDFIKNPPLKGKILADSITYQQKVIKSPNVEMLTQHANPETADYIFSTYHTPYEEDGFIVSEAVVDASNGTVSNQQLSWFLRSIGISENNPLPLKGVDIVYNQPGKIIYKE